MPCQITLVSKVADSTSAQSSKEIKRTPVEFTVTPDDLENVRPVSIAFHSFPASKKIDNSIFCTWQGANVRIPEFLIAGNLRSATCDITKPFVGELVVKESSAPIRSIELQLVRVETCGCADGYAKERKSTWFHYLSWAVHL